MSVKFVSAILGPEMAAPILWTPGKFLVLGGGGIFGFWGGGGECRFYFYGREDFSDNCHGTLLCEFFIPKCGGVGRTWLWDSLVPHAPTQGTRESQTLFPTARGSLRTHFPPQKGKPRTSPKSLAWPSLQSLAVKKSFIFCKFWAVKNFLNLVKNGRWKIVSRPERG